MAKEAYFLGKRGLRLGQKRPGSWAKEAYLGPGASTPGSHERRAQPLATRPPRRRSPRMLVGCFVHKSCRVSCIHFGLGGERELRGV